MALVRGLPGDGAKAASGRILVEGRGRGALLRMRAPISFWGGIDPSSGRVMDPRHPDHGVCITGRILALPATVGSSSSSAIMLELLREKTAPAAILLGRADAILALGAVVARELGYLPIPVVEIDMDRLAAFSDGTVLRVAGAEIRVDQPETQDR